MSYEAQQGAPPDSDPTNAIGLAVGAMTGLALDFPADFEPGGGGPTGPPAPPPACGEEFSLSSQPEAQEIAVLFGEDSWNLPVYSYDAVSMEDLYMLQAMYNQAAGSKKFNGTPAGVAATINLGTYNGYARGRVSLINTLAESINSNEYNHLVSAEATYSEFWDDGSQNLSNVNRWVSVGYFGPLPSGQIQIAGTVVYYIAGTVAPAVGQRRHPIIPLPVNPVHRRTGL